MAKHRNKVGQPISVAGWRHPRRYIQRFSSNCVVGCTQFRYIALRIVFRARESVNPSVRLSLRLRALARPKSGSSLSHRWLENSFMHAKSHFPAALRDKVILSAASRRTGFTASLVRNEPRITVPILTTNAVFDCSGSNWARLEVLVFGVRHVNFLVCPPPPLLSLGSGGDDAQSSREEGVFSTIQ